MLYLIFGVSTPSVVAVTSAFMAGLALGSYLSGKISPKQKNILKFYALLEFTIGLAGLLLPIIFQLITSFYTSIYQLTGSSQIIFLLKFLLTFLAIIIPTTAMGATLPAFVEFLERNFRSSLSFETGILYAINTLGAFAGVLLTGFVLIEIFGLLYTSWIAIVINFSLGFIIWKFSQKKLISLKEMELPKPDSPPQVPLGIPLKLALIIFALSGAVSLAYEIAWTRLLTPITGTFIYAFSFILALILLGIALGSFLSKYLFHVIKNPFLSFALIEFIIGVGAVLSVLATTSLFHLSTIFTELLVILPSTLAMGMSFPAILRLAPPQIQGSTFVGKSYMFNTIGSMLGPIIGGFILIPLLGSSQTVIILACLNLIFAALLSISDLSIKKEIRDSFVFLCLSIILLLSLLPKINPDIYTEKTRKSHADSVRHPGNKYSYIEDESASVEGFYTAEGVNGLLVNGVGMTSLVQETKIMAHLPILISPNPKNMLIICFGMGTTFRSALSYGINVDAVELVPAVIKTFPIFFADANDVLANPKGKIIINDGRNYVRLTNKKYDIIQVDPPPPINSAGTTVLYSQNFYEDSKRILSDNGIFVEWIVQGAEQQDINMLIKSFINAFPYVSAFNSPNGIGTYLVGSLKPLKINLAQVEKRLADNPKAFADLNEWEKWDAQKILNLYAGDRNKYIAQTASVPPLTDNFPRTEYFLLRQSFPQYFHF